MLLILEIALTVSAWKKGWRALALVPVAIGLMTAFVVGLLVGMDVLPSEIVPFTALLDLAMIAALFMMTRRSPRPVSGSNRAAEPAMSHAVTVSE